LAEETSPPWRIGETWFLAVPRSGIAQPAVFAAANGRREAAGDGGLSGHMWILDIRLRRFAQHALETSWRVS